MVKYHDQPLIIVRFRALFQAQVAMLREGESKEMKEICRQSGYQEMMNERLKGRKGWKSTHCDSLKFFKER